MPSDSAERAGDAWRVRVASDAGERELHARLVLNAAGPWINQVRERIAPRPPGFEVELVAGTHLELPGPLERGIYYVEAPRDGRAVFAIPWKGRTLVGTTETRYAGDPASVSPTREEVEYLRATYAAYFPARPTEVLDAWAGLRVLPRGSGAAFDRPRETTLVVDDERRPTTLAIYGGKLTGYRATAAKVVERLRGSLPPRELRRVGLALA